MNITRATRYLDFYMNPKPLHPNTGEVMARILMALVDRPLAGDIELILDPSQELLLRITQPRRVLEIIVETDEYDGDVDTNFHFWALFDGEEVEHCTPFTLEECLGLLDFHLSGWDLKTEES